MSAIRSDYTIPKGLGPRALKKLGRFRDPVKRFVEHANAIGWLERAGRPEPWDAKVIRVWDLEEAKRADERFAPVNEAVWTSLGDIGKALGRFEIMEAAESYWIAEFAPAPTEPSYVEEILPAQIESDLVGALREIILHDAVPVRFFRHAIDWYAKGHWRCAIDPTGRPIVF